MHDQLREACRGRWQSILTQLGVPHDAISGYNRPCPMCTGKDRFRFDDIDGNGTWFCRHCGGPNGSGGAGDGIGLAMKFLGINFTEAVKRVEAVIGMSTKRSTRQDARDRDYAQEAQSWLWKHSPGLRGDDPPSYYLASRCITVIPPLTAVRWAEHVKDVDPDTKVVTHHHAMMSRCVAPDDSRAALHYTLLDQWGAKAPVKRVRQFARGCVVPKGGAVRLFDPAEEMGVAEGIETAMSAAILFHMPVWAALSKGGMINFVPPPICRRLVIYADRDHKWDGQFAAVSLAYRLSYHTEVRPSVEYPADAEFKDWNDVLKARGPILVSDNVVPIR